MSSLTCPACGRQVATSGAGEPPTTCPACGASLLASEPLAPGDAVDASATSAAALAGLEDDSATRPVPVDQLPTRPSPSPAPAPLATPEQAAPARGATQDLPASALPPSGGGSTGGGGSGRRAGGALRAAGVIALLALLAVVVVGAALAVNGNLPFLQTAASPTATAPRAAPTSTATTTLYERAGLYQIRYPNGWVTTEQNSPPSVYQVTIQNPHGGASVSITAQQSPVFVDASANDANYLNGLAATTNTKAQNLSQPQAVTLASQTWTEESADVSIQTTSGAQYAHAAALSVNHGGWVYTIVRLAPWPDQAGAGAAFTAADQASFQPMLATFAFLGA